MDRREFLKKFVALSSASLLIDGCTKLQDSSTDKKIKDITSNPPNNTITPKKIEESSMPVAVYGPPPVPRGMK